VAGVAVSLLVSGLTVDISNTFRGVFKVRRVKLMLRISEFREFYRILLFCLPLNITSLKRFTRYGHYAGKGRQNHRQSRSFLLNCCAKNYSV